jgi:protocatechuate 3,4-dioxygenase, beta subunit
MSESARDPVTGYRRPGAGTQPPHDSPEYGSTRLRYPQQAPLRLPHTPTETSAPRFGPRRYPATADLTVCEGGRHAMGERIIVAGRVLDEDGRPVRRAMVEVWQANAAGRYPHEGDTHDAPEEPGFRGMGRVFTDDAGQYRFVTIKPGAYPWRNHHNAWRPNHIHFSLFGAGLAQRLITQMYFPGDPLLALDPIFNSTPDERARQRLVSRFDIELTQPEWALGYQFDIVLRGHDQTPFEDGHDHVHAHGDH